MSEINLKIKQIKNIIERSKKMTFDNLVTWEYSEDWKIGEQRNLNESLSTKIFASANIMIFHVFIPNHFAEHWHNFAERIFMIGGKITDNYGNSYKKGDWIKYGNLKEHGVTSMNSEAAELIVIFTR